MPTKPRGVQIVGRYRWGGGGDPNLHPEPALSRDLLPQLPLQVRMVLHQKALLHTHHSKVLLLLWFMAVHGTCARLPMCGFSVFRMLIAVPNPTIMLTTVCSLSSTTFKFGHYTDHLHSSTTHDGMMQ